MSRLFLGKRCYVPVRYIPQSINHRLGRWILPQVHTFTLLQDDKRRKKMNQIHFLTFSSKIYKAVKRYPNYGINAG